MGQAKTIVLIAVLGAVFLVLAGLAVLADGFYFAKHEGDTLHAMEIILRLADGRIQHRDFMTPIGGLAFWPMALMVQAGVGIGKAMLGGQVIFAAALFPALIWIGHTRLKTGPAMLFGGSVLVLSLALIFGDASAALSISMHYNRWAWALTFIAVTIVAIPPQRPGTIALDGVILGLACLGLLMLKATYFVAFVPIIILASFVQGQRAALGVGIVAGFIGLGVLTLVLGPSYWGGYLLDLIKVALADSRPFPGLPFTEVMGAPLYLGGSLAGLAGVIFLRQGGAKKGGLLLLFLLPAFFYVTYQNWGNDPQWLILLAVLLMAWMPAPEATNGFGWNMRTSTIVVVAMTLAFASPSYLNMIYSPFRHFFVDKDVYTPLIPGNPAFADLLVPGERALKVQFRRPATEGIVEFDIPRAEDDEPPEPEEFRGDVFEECALAAGPSAYFASMASALEENGFTGDKGVFVADTFSALWLFTDLRPLKGGAPWYYANLTGMDDADYFLVPTCALNTPVRRAILKDVTEAEIAMQEVYRHPLFILYAL